MSKDPSVGVRLPRSRRREAAMRLPSTDEVRRLLAAAEPDFQPFIALCAFGGLRFGETSGLRVGDIEFPGHRIHVARQVQRARSADIEVRLPKLGSERTVQMPDNLGNMLAAHIAKLPSESTSESWLFQDKAGDPLLRATVYRLWMETKKRAKVTGVRLHDLRHYFASGLIAAGCDVIAVQRSLGHTTATMTLNTYAHLWPREQDRTRDAAAAMFADVIQHSDEKLTNQHAIQKSRDAVT